MVVHGCEEVGNIGLVVIPFIYNSRRQVLLRLGRASPRCAEGAAVTAGADGRLLLTSSDSNDYCVSFCG
jgi:hypothetical protein